MSHIKQIKKIGHSAIDFILPPLCPATGEMVDKLGMVDSAFWQNLNFIHTPLCTVCGVPFSFNTDDMTCGDCLESRPVFNQHRSAIAYDDYSKSLILRFKHGDQTHATKAFTPWLQQAGRTMLDKADFILPVPLHSKRLLKRRYNQSDLIARDLCRHYPTKTYYPDGLIRIKNTPSQGHKKPNARTKNVRKAFSPNPKYDFKDKNILVIDDVFTTGATLNECAKTLYDIGAKQVNCLTVARPIKT